LRVVFALCVAVSTAAGSVVAGAANQEAGTAAPHGDRAPAVFRSAVDLVALNVIVTDAKQRFVKGLQLSDFVVFEEGVTQDVTFFSAGEAPLDVALLLDTSASMAGQLPGVRAAALSFLRVVRDIDRVMVLDLKNTTRVLHPLDGDASRAQRAIQSIEPGGTTGLYNGLYLTMRQLVGGRASAGDHAVRRQAIVALSDGRDTSSLLSFEDVRELARRAGISLYVIQLDSPKARRPSQVSRVLTSDEYSLRELAAETGGRAFFPDSVDDLTGVYEAIAAELAHQYALGYTPKAAGAADGFRRVSVQVAERPGVRARTRAGYLTLASRVGT
jgi:Ca-activated chloride channel family protein